MFTSPERKPSVSNWFSSLRRQPKQKKPINNGKRLQKSCVDLSTVVTPSTTTTQPMPTNLSLIDNNSSSSSSTIINETLPSTVLLPTVNVKNGLENGVNSGGNRTINFDKLTIVATSTSPTKISKTNTIEIDQIKTKSSKSSSAATSPTTAAMPASSSSEFKITTTTKVTSTTVVTKQIHRVGLVFNDNGELISNLESFRNFANNLNSKLLSITLPSTLSDNNNDSRGNLSLLNGDDIEYIDDTTTTSTQIPSSSSHSDIRHKDTKFTASGKQLSSSCVTCKNSSSSSSHSNNHVKSKMDTNSRTKKVILIFVKA